MSPKTIWDSLYDEEWLSNLNAKLRKAQTLADRQVFGLTRQSTSIEFKTVLTSVRDEINSILKRVEEAERKK